MLTKNNGLMYMLSLESDTTPITENCLDITEKDDKFIIKEHNSIVGIAKSDSEVYGEILELMESLKR